MATRSEDFASQAFRKHFAELVEAIQDPDRLALELYANDVILLTTRDEITLTTFTREQKNTKLLAAVESQVHVDPKAFEVFLSALRKRIPLAALCRRIEEAYCPQIAKVLPGDYAREFSTSSSEAVSLLPEPVPGSVSPSDRDVLVPQDQRDTSSSFPYLDMGKLSKRDRLTLQSKLLKDSDDIISEFGDLIHYTITSIVASRVSVMKLRTRLSSLGAYRPTRDPVPLLRNQLNEIKRAEDVEEVFSILDDYYSFFNYGIIEKIIGWFGTQEDKERLEAYMEHFKRFCQRRTFECPSNVFGHTVDKGKSNLVMKVEESWDPNDGCSLEIVLRLRNSLSEILGVESETLYLCRIDKGCVELLFQVPSFVEEDIFPLSMEQERSLVSIGVARLICGSYSYLQPPEPLAPQISAHAENQVQQELPTESSLEEFGSVQEVTFQQPHSDECSVSNQRLDEGLSPPSKRQKIDTLSSVQEEKIKTATNTSGSAHQGCNVENKSPSLEELLSGVSKKTLDQPCSDDHIITIAAEITDWQIIAPLLRLAPADEENILQSNRNVLIQNRQMLRTWKQQFGSKATYGTLAGALYKAKRVDLVEKVVNLLLTEKTAVSSLKPTPLTFHQQCGIGVQVKNGMQVEHYTHPGGLSFGSYSYALTSRPLKTEETFEIELLRPPIIDRPGWLTLGVTTQSPGEITNFPKYMSKLTPGTWMLDWYGRQDRDNVVMVNGTEGKQAFVSGNTLRSLKTAKYVQVPPQKGQGIGALISHFQPEYKKETPGDRVALRVTQKGELVFFINREKKGVVATGIPEGVYGFVELPCEYTEVGLVPHNTAVPGTTK